MLDSWKRAAKLASQGNGPLYIEGYKDQAGRILDLVVSLLPQTGYKELLASSLKQLEQMRDQGEVTKARFGLQDVADDVLSDAFVDNCACELLLSYQERIAKPFQSNDKLIAGEGWFEDPERPDTVILLGMLRMHEIVVQDDRAQSKTSDHKWGKSAVKKQIENFLPISFYLGRLNLELGRVLSVTVKSA